MKRIVFVLVALTLSAAPSLAQTYPTMTTLSSAVAGGSSTQPPPGQLRLTSGTNVQAGGALFVDQEYMDITGCANAACTIVNVNRTARPAAHAAGAVVFVATQAMKPNIMLRSAGAYRVGQCSTSTSSSPATALGGLYQYLPLIDIDTATVYNCRRIAGGVWTWVRTNVQAMNTLDGSVPTAWP